MVSAICAVLTVIGAGFSWWRSNLSKAALQSADEAKQRILDQVAALERQAESAERNLAEMRSIADSLRGPDFTLEHVVRSKFALTNRTSEQATIESVVNRAAFMRIDLPDGQVLEPDEVCQFLVTESGGLPLSPNLELRISGRLDLVRLPLIKHS